MSKLSKYGPKLAVGGIAACAVLLIAAQFDRGRDLRPAAAAKPQERAVKTASASLETRIVERSRDQPVKVDPNALAVKSVLPIKQPFRHGDFMWDESGAPATGRLIITVDLKAQVLSAFRDGHEIGAAVIVYGANDKPSPIGAFPITQKDADHVSSTYDGAPMPFMLRLTNDGVAIHGSDVYYGNATHGCIGVPTDFARKLFKVAKLGDIVVITDGKMLDTTHAKTG
jgi:lipoprotein-anchoring transpeptidase ErfK/SrfK